MKKYCLLLLLLLPVVGCRNELKCLEGTYSYKVSGKAVIDAGDSTNTVVLEDEIGAMEIIGQSDNRVILTFNQLAGSAYTTSATLNDSILTLVPFERVITYERKHDVTVSGKGHIYDQTIVFDLQYSSDKLNADKITMIAKHN
ncbi:MAG: hypothetical protein MJZ88_05905 [Paludibacteraceae bacterium]|nr:hypothetical protein [Paludibacteraceae bacterium]